MEEDGTGTTAKIPAVIQRQERSRDGWHLGTAAESKNRALGRYFRHHSTDPNTKMAEIHNRQPVILQHTECAEWLAESERAPVHVLRILAAENRTVTEWKPPLNRMSHRRPNLVFCSAEKRRW